MFAKLNQKWLTIEQKMPPLSERVYRSLGLVMILILTIAYSILMLNWYWQFEYFFVDNVYFHTALWRLAEGLTPIVHHPMLGNITIFGDHFHPTILIFALLLKLIPMNEIIFVGMAVTLGIGGYLAMEIGFMVLKNRGVSLIMVLAYFLYLGTQNAMIYGFHELNLVPMFFLLAVWGLLKKKWRIYWVGFGLLLLTKESMVALGIGLAWFIFWTQPKQRKLAYLTLGISIIYYIIATRIIIPHFSGGTFLYSPSIPHSLPQLWTALFSPHEKIQTFVVSMMSFGWLPLLNIAILPLVLQDFVVRYVFALEGNVQYTLSYHYGLGLVPILFLSSIWSLKTIQDRWHSNLLIVGFAALTLVTTMYYQRFYSIKAPLLLVTNKAFYQTTKNNAFLWEFLQHVPHNATVVTMNHLGLPLTKDDTVYPLPPHIYDFVKVQPDYIVYDLRSGQNPVNFYMSTETDFKESVTTLLKQNKYRIYYQNNDQYILAKNENAYPK